MFGRFSYFMRETWVSLRRNVLMTTAGVITVAVSLCVLGGALLMSRFVDHGTQKWENGVEFEIFMNIQATSSQVSAVQAQLKSEPDVRSYRYLTKDDAYKEFKRLFGSDQPELVTTITAADLPESFRVAPRKASLSTTVADRFKGQPGVTEVKSAPQAVKSLLATTRVVRLIFLVIFGALLFASLFLIVNTIRLATYARRREIEVMKLVGASNWFVRVPFMLEGMVQGLIGAAIGVGAVWGLQQLLTDNISRADDSWRGFFVTAGDASQVSIIVLLLGAGIGVIGAVVGLRRFLDV